MKLTRLREQYRFGYVIEFQDGFRYELLRIYTHENNTAEWEIFGYLNGEMIRGELVERYIGTHNGCKVARKKIIAHHRSASSRRMAQVCYDCERSYGRHQWRSFCRCNNGGN